MGEPALGRAAPRSEQETTGPAGVIRRTALVERLEVGATAPVMLVAAPAGSGKTLLVRSWLDGRAPRLSAWVAVERGERDGQRFWLELLQAVRAAGPAGVVIEVPQPTPEFDGQAVVERLVTSLAALQEPLVLVVDDLHELLAPDALEQLRYLLEHLPDLLHVVLVTRRDPQLGLHRRRLAGELAELRGHQLSFTLDEARQLLVDAGVGLSPEGLARLHERTEGWAAGLRLAVLTLTAHPDPERLVADFSGSDRTVAEYLLAEVLDAQSPRIRRLLTRTALLRQVNGALADLLTGEVGAEGDLRALADAGAFVVAVDPQRTWFRFHHLFADLLALELRQTEPEEIPRLHLAAADWYAAHDRVLDAITHAGAGGDRERAVGLLIAHYFSLTFDGRKETASSLLKQFGLVPGEVVSPEIMSVLAAEELVEGSLEEADSYLELAQRQAAAVPAERRSGFAVSLLLTQLSLARRRGDFRFVLAHRQPADLVDEPVSERGLARHHDVRAATLMSLGIVEVWSGRVDDGTGHLAEAEDLARKIGRPYVEVMCRAHWAYATSWSSFTRSQDAARDAIALAESHGWGSDPVLVPALVTLAAALVQSGRLAEAESVLARADQTLRPELEPTQGFLLHLVHGVDHLARGRSSAALESFQAAERLGLKLRSDSPIALQLRCLTLGAMVAVGETVAVAAALQRFTAVERGTGEVREVVAALALAGGDPRRASASLAPTLDGSAPTHHPLVVVRSLLLEALARDAQGEGVAAQDAVERALDLAEADALVSPFMHVESRALLERHPHHRTAHAAFVAELLDVLSRGGATQAGHHPGPAHEGLSEAELRVLGYLPTNLSLSSIALEIYLSVNTVKTHIQHIYLKLDAHDRAGAVKRARELGMLARSRPPS